MKTTAQKIKDANAKFFDALNDAVAQAVKVQSLPGGAICYFADGSGLELSVPYVTIIDK